jgi:hypothetical protein
MASKSTKTMANQCAGKASSDIPALKPYRGKPAVRNFLGEAMETSASFEARSAPLPYPTCGRRLHSRKQKKRAAITVIEEVGRVFPPVVSNRFGGKCPGRLQLQWP